MGYSLSSQHFYYMVFEKTAPRTGNRTNWLVPDRSVNAVFAMRYWSSVALEINNR